MLQFYDGNMTSAFSVRDAEFYGGPLVCVQQVPPFESAAPVCIQINGPLCDHTKVTALPQ